MDYSNAFVAARNPPILDKSNYEEWKMKTMVNIRAIDEDAWTAVQYGWQTPKIYEKKLGLIIKPKEMWTDEEKRLSKFNAKALSVIFNGVDVSQFRLIQNCESAKEAWDILQKTFKRTQNEKLMQLKILASKFENLQMGAEDKVADFCLEICCIASDAQALGEKYEENKLVKKLLQCLPAKFALPRAGIQTLFKIDDVKFDDVRNMLIVHELGLEFEILAMKEK